MQNEVEAGQVILYAIAKNWPLILGLLVAIYVVYRIVRWSIDSYRSAKAWVGHVVDERLPSSMKSTLMNGGGEIIRKIVNEENQKQVEAVRGIVNSAIKDHEDRFDSRLDREVKDHSSRIDDLEDNLDGLESRIRRRRKGRS